MKILFVVPYTPNLIRVRPYQLIRALARRGHQLTVLTLWTTEAERESLRQLAAGGIRVVVRRLSVQRRLWNAARGLPGRAPLQATFCVQPALARALRSLLRAPGIDVVHVEHLRGAWYGLQAVEALGADDRRAGPRGGGRPAVVWDSVDCISHLFAQAARESRGLKGRLMARLELGRTRRYEGWLAAQFDRALVASDADRRALLALSGRPAPVSVLPNGVDLAYFTPLDEPREPATLVMTGKMSYHANVTAALHLVHDIMPLVWARRPDTRVLIVGKDPAREVRALATSGLAHGRVEVVGGVPDLRPYLRGATIAVAPVVYGAGIQNKVLEAMACGAPVVASPRAASALAVQSGRDLVLAGGPAAFAQAVLELLDAPDRCAALGRAGRTFVETHHDWTAVAAQLEQIYRDAAEVVAGAGPAPRAVRAADTSVSGVPLASGGYIR